MWLLVRTELGYHRGVLLLWILVAMPLLALLMAIMAWVKPLPSGFVKLMPLLAAWGLAAHLVEVHSRERRGALATGLPLTARQVGVVRILIPWVSMAAALAAFAAAEAALGQPNRFGTLIFLGMGLVLLVYGMQAMAEDLFSERRHSTAPRYAPVVVILLGILVLGFYVALTRDQPHPVLARLFGSPVEFLASTHGPLWFLVGSAVPGVASVFTYERRRSYPGS